MRASTLCRRASAVLYALIGAVAACGAVVTFAIGVLTQRIDSAHEARAAIRLRRSSFRPAFEVAPLAETRRVEEISAALSAIEAGPPETVDEASGAEDESPINFNRSGPSAFARNDRNGPRDARRAAGAADPDRQLFVGRGQLQDLLRRLDRGRNERRHVSIRLDERLQAPSHRDQGEDDVRHRIDPRLVWIFLDSARFGTKTPDFERWISLDFLGFSRPNRDLSMSYMDFSREKNSRALFRGSSAGTGPRAPWAFRRRRIAHPSSLALFLVFRNRLYPIRFLSALQPKARRSTG